MRYLRALICLAFAFAFTSATMAQARVFAHLSAAAIQHDMHVADDVSAHGIDHAAANPDAPAKQHGPHKQDTCQTACCFVAARIAGRPEDVGAADFYSAVRYADTAPPLSDRVSEPEPGIPKRPA